MSDPNVSVPGANPSLPPAAEVAHSASDPRPPASITSDPPRGPFDIRIVALGIYLIVFLLLSANWLAGLMMADTTDGKLLAGCYTNTNTNGNANGNGNANTGAIQSANGAASNVNVSANTNTNTSGVPSATPIPPGTAANSNPAGAPSPNPSPSPDVSPSPAKPPATTTTPENSDILVTKIVSIDNQGLFGVEFLSARRFTKNGCVTADGYLFLIVLFSGLLGAVIRAISSLYWHLGQRDFKLNWAWYYILQPFFGGALGLVFYLVLRGGFGGGTVGKGNVFAFAAVGALAGLFSDNAMAKLKKIAESLLEKPIPATEKREPTKPQEPPPTPPSAK